MTQKLLLSLVTIPALASSILVVLIASSVHASKPLPSSYLADTSILSAASCDVIPQDLVSSRINSDFSQDGILVAATQIPVIPASRETPYDLPLDFSEAESDAAVALFGCDCSSCIRALRQLRQTPLSSIFPTEQLDINAILGNQITSPTINLSSANGLLTSQLVPENLASTYQASSSVRQGHCWDNLQRRSTPTHLRNILETLEAAETIS